MQLDQIRPEHAIKGIHHITLISSDAQRTVDFYTRLLGLRMVKQTVNFDDPGSYHLYFGDELGRPGTIVTFFEWPHAGKGRTGIGGTHHFALLTETTESLLKWKRWLTDNGVAVDGVYDRTYFRSIYFRDPDGVIVEIATRGPGWSVDEDPAHWGEQEFLPPPDRTIRQRDEARIRAETWSEPVAAIGADMHLPGLHHIPAVASDIERTGVFYNELLGLRLVKRTVNFDDPSAPHYYFAAPDGHPGSVITYFGYGGRMRHAQMGVGLTHHFALEVGSEDAQHFWRERLIQAGLRPTPILDRQYFNSIYFHDPDGHIVELATSQPGFAIDEAPAELGRHLKLPPWLESSRSGIEAGLKPLEVTQPETQEIAHNDAE
ncbi:MAG TPA: VOC family protein [Herpetosiphonaceae bacterium]